MVRQFLLASPSAPPWAMRVFAGSVVFQSKTIARQHVSSANRAKYTRSQATCWGSRESQTPETTEPPPVGRGSVLAPQAGSRLASRNMIRASSCVKGSAHMLLNYHRNATKTGDRYRASSIVAYHSSSRV